MKRVLILDCALSRGLYDPTRQWRRLLSRVASDSVHLPSGGAVPDLGAYSHVVITGSEASILRPEPWFDAGIEAVVRAAGLGLPILGSCFGHQMLARALSGPAAVASAPTPEVGWMPVALAAPDPLLDGLPDPFWAFAFHFDEVRNPPPPWRVLARSATCAVQVMRYGDAPIYGIQAHPEIPPDEGRALVEGFLARHPERADLLRPALAATPRDDGVATEIVGRFLALEQNGAGFVPGAG